MKTMNLALIYVLFLSIIIWLQLEQQQYVHALQMGEVIPDEAIRLRILAHDNSLKEQMIKADIRDAINEEVRQAVGHVQEKEAARKEIKKLIPTLEKVSNDVLKSHRASHDVSIALKEDVQFPTRVYGPIVYPQGTYEALVITIGDGKGENWWCVLFPALCFIETDQEKDVDTVDKNGKYTFFIVEKWKEWFGKDRSEEV